MKYGFVKVAAVTPKIKVADTKYNGQLIRTLMKDAEKAGARVVAFPELAITGASGCIIASTSMRTVQLTQQLGKQLLKIVVVVDMR